MKLIDGVILEPCATDPVAPQDARAAGALWPTASRRAPSGASFDTRSRSPFQASPWSQSCRNRER